MHTSARFRGMTRPLLAAVLWATALDAQQPSASIGGRVVRRGAGTPVDGARVTVLGTALIAFSDSGGVFTFPAVPAGVRVVQVRTVGYEPGSWIVQLGEGQQFRQDLEVVALPVEIAGVTVTGRPEDDWRTEAGFEARRLAGRGWYITREEIAVRRPESISDLLRGAPGVTVTCRGVGGCIVGFGRSVGRRCTPEYFLDGYPATFATGPTFPINQIRGVEVYRDQSETPVEFQRAGLRCGVIAIWTIEPGERFDRN